MTISYLVLNLQQFSSAEGGFEALQVSLLESNMIVCEGKVMHVSFYFILVCSKVWKRCCSILFNEFLLLIYWLKLQLNELRKLFQSVRVSKGLDGHHRLYGEWSQDREKNQAKNRLLLVFISTKTLERLLIRIFVSLSTSHLNLKRLFLTFNYYFPNVCLIIYFLPTPIVF